MHVCQGTGGGNDGPDLKETLRSPQHTPGRLSCSLLDSPAPAPSTDEQHCTWLYVGSGDLNSGPCAARALFIEPSPQIFVCLFRLSISCVPFSWRFHAWPGHPLRGAAPGAPPSVTLSRTLFLPIWLHSSHADPPLSSPMALNIFVVELKPRWDGRIVQ